MRHALLVLAALPCLAATDPLYLSAQRKMDQIKYRHYKPGSVVLFTPQELNAWARVKVPEFVPEGLRTPAVVLGTTTASGTALVDFLKMRHGQGQETGWLLSKLIEGERPLKAEIRMESSAGKATVYLTRVELGGASLSGKTLEFLITNFFKPLFPDAKINEPFELDFAMQKIEVLPTGVRVFIGR